MLLKTMSDLYLPLKWTLRTGGQKVVFCKRSNEKASHVWMKAFLWALYLPEYPGLKVEVEIDDRYKPDVVALGPDGRPLFWGEAGETSAAKIRSLARRYRETHLAIAKWGTKIEPHLAIVEAELKGLKRSAPVDVIGFPLDSPEQFVAGRDEIAITLDDVRRVRFSS